MVGPKIYIYIYIRVELSEKECLFHLLVHVVIFRVGDPFKKRGTESFGGDFHRHSSNDNKEPHMGV